MNVNEIVTNSILEKIEEAEQHGKAFYWVKPFSEGAPKQPYSYEKTVGYTGINRLLLDADEYLTFNKASEMNCTVRKGAKANIVIYFNLTKQKDEDGEVLKDKDGNEIKRGYLKFYRVFSRQDILNQKGENIPSKFNFKHYSHEEMNEQMRNSLLLFSEMVKAYCEKNGITIEIIKDGTEAYYMPNKNIIRIPDMANFKSVYEYMHTVAHEMVHSTMKPLNRETDKTVSTLEEMMKSYSKEELVAEIGAEMIIQNLCIPDDRQNQDNTIAYLQGWSKYLKDKKQELVSAAAKAEEASDYILEYNKELEHTEQGKQNNTDREDR